MEGELVAGEVSILCVDEGVGALVVDAALMARRVSVGSEYEPVVSLVRDDGVRLVIVVTGVTYRRLGNIEVVVVSRGIVVDSCCWAGTDVEAPRSCLS